MRLNKNKKSGLFILVLLFLIIGCISTIKIAPIDKEINKNSISLSALEDNYEDNDDPSSAYDIRTLEAIWLSSQNGNGTQWDDDWYWIDLDPGEERLKVILIFNQFEGNIDIEVYNSKYDYIAGNYSVDDNEFLEFDLFPSGDYYLRIFGANAGNVYDLLWEDLNPIDDPFEQNDDFYNAAWIDPNWYSNLKIIDNDEDWFQTYLNYGETIDVSIYFTHDDGDLQLELYDPNYSNRVGSYSSSSFNSEEKLKFTADMSGEWRIRVYRISGSIDLSYDLDLWLYPGDDWMEDNDDYGSAHWVDPQYYPDLMIMGDDEDWFKIYLDSDDIIDIKIYFDNSQGNLQLELYDPTNSGNPRIDSYNDWNDESITFTADRSGEWRIRIYQVDGSSDVWYNMEIWINGMMVGDDPYEPNNHIEEAYDLRDYERKWLSKIHGLAVQGDEDWYLIDVTPGFQHLMVNLTFNSSQGHINIELFRLWDRHNLDWNAVYSNYSMTGENKAVINYLHIEPSMYMIQIRGDSKGVEYNLWWDDLRTDLRSDDNYEENDDILFAYDLSDHEDQGLWSINGLAIQNDTDWYKIQVNSGFEHLFVLVMYDFQEGRIGIEIVDWAGSKVTSNFTMQDNEIINYDLPSNGTYYIRIFGDYTGNLYNLRWKTSPPTTEMIPGYDIFILLGVVFGVVVLLTLKWKRSRKCL